MPQLFLRLLSEATSLSAHDAVDAADDDMSAGLAETDTEYDISAGWLIQENNGDVRAQGTSNFRDLSELIDPNAGWLTDPDNIVVILPSRYVLALQCEVPGRNAGQIRRALPFAAEEYVATDIELMHIASDTIKAGLPVRCNIVERSILDDWLACLGQLGLHPGFMVTEADLLPSDDERVALLYENDSVVIAAPGQAVEIDAANLGFALEGIAAQRIVTINGRPDDITLGQLDPIPEIDEVALPGGVLEYLAEQFAERQLQAINILQGAYQPQRAVNPQARRWGGVLALVAGWILIAFVGMLVQGWWASQEADRLTADSFAFYESVFRNESQPVSIEQLRRRVNAKLGRTQNAGAGGQTSDFIGLMAHLANTIDGDSAVMSANYQREELSVEVMLPSYDDLDPVKNELANVGVEVNVTSAEQDGQQVRSRMRLKFN